jgi:hypothetical protein
LLLRPSLHSHILITGLNQSNNLLNRNLKPTGHPNVTVWYSRAYAKPIERRMNRKGVSI